MASLIDQAEAALARMREIAALRVEEETVEGHVYMVPSSAMTELDRLAGTAPSPGISPPCIVSTIQAEMTLVGPATGKTFPPFFVVSKVAFPRARDNHNGDGARWQKIRDEWDAAYEAAVTHVNDHLARVAELRENNDFVPRHGRE